MTSRELEILTPEQRQTINKYLSTYPVRLGAMARELGIGAIKVSSMRPGTSGQITKEDNQYIIRVNRHEARERQRFTIAHEIAHFLLHRHIIDKQPEGITDNVLYRSGEPEAVEFEANRLAADLVMPMDLVEQRLSDDFDRRVTEATIESLAATFGVSKAAMEIRLSTLVAA